jgi:hypothetical protein
MVFLGSRWVGVADAACWTIFRAFNLRPQGLLFLGLSHKFSARFRIIAFGRLWTQGGKFPARPPRNRQLLADRRFHGEDTRSGLIWP